MAFREIRSLVEEEEKTLALWESEGTFERVLEARRREAAADPKRVWVFYDGPPTANGKPGLHHLIARSIKDFACRLKTMEGRLVERKAGWDTHGLPVEIEAEKTLGLQGKEAIERMGIAAFNAVCRESVFKYLADWRRFTRRSGYWLDLDDAYVTCSNEYVESLWAILANFHRRGLLFKGHKVLPYCPRCATPLSSHEVAQGYQDVQDPSVYVRFRALDAAGNELPESFLVWTTTPWTLPSNVALAVHPDVDYVQVRLDEGGGKTETLWLAEPRLSSLKAKPEQVHVVERVKGSALVGRRYRRLLDFYDVEAAPNAFTVRPATFVTTEDGTGIVHMAPAYGEDDALVGRRDALPTLHPVDSGGRFVAGPRAEVVAGKFVKDADKDVLRHLKGVGLLFRQETIVHSYPHCWRCDTPLLYYARDSWYLKTTQFRERMVELNRSVKWYPESTGSGRFGQWLENNVDWAISRDRYWGTPLPLWLCDACGRQEAIGSVAELRERAGPLPEPVDLHRPWVDERTWTCGASGCRGTMRRTPEIADVWFDSGAMPFAQWHHPFENQARVEREVPADFVAEAVDQTRGWFYTLLAVSTMYADKPAYRACVSTDMVLDAKGKKMSKSKGNVVDPMAVMAKYGADVVRWYLLTSRPLWMALRFNESDLEEVRNRVFRSFGSSYSFFALYANADGFDEASPPSGWKPKDVFDRWLLSRLSRLVSEVTLDLKDYETSKAGKRISDFVAEDLSNWYVRRNRRRFWRGALDDDKRDAYRSLRQALLSLTRLIAPFAPFLPDAIHRELAPERTSVHLARWPDANGKQRDEELEHLMSALRTVVSLGHAARNKAGVRVRQPLSVLRTGHAEPLVMDFLKEHRQVLMEELNVKRVELVGGLASSATISVALNKKFAAPRLGRLTAPTEAALSAYPAEKVRDLAAAIFREGVRRFDLAGGEKVDLGPDDVRFDVVDTEGGASAFAAGILVRLDTTLTPELRREGLVREFVHALQGLRKDKGLRVTDRVRLAWSAEGELADAIRAHEAYVKDEVLATSMTADAQPAGGDVVEVEGSKAVVSLEVVPA
jgi:isoleucyl-tRNA synthetase